MWEVFGASVLLKKISFIRLCIVLMAELTFGNEESENKIKSTEVEYKVPYGLSKNVYNFHLRCLIEDIVVTRKFWTVISRKCCKIAGSCQQMLNTKLVAYDLS